MTRLIFVRHGETAWNVELRFQGQRDTALSARGRVQAQQVAERLRHEPIRAVYSSDLSRAVDTARAIAAVHGLPVVPDAALRERNFGDWEGCTAAEVRARWPDGLQHWQRAPHEYTPPHGESLAAVAARVQAKIRDIVAAHPDATVVIVGHGGSIRAAVLTALNQPLSEWRSVRVDNASLTVLQFHPHGVEVVQLNDLSHLKT
ncbi:MAG: alpha-ribazole phosphatase [Abditibacteriales bacterium]|nr:alpha-ribazole phosphatase [Abditibacteriales bacterium]MDW8368534.1 alpha-ribazole phosphatase [Abditibacteriales bacterium]